MLLKFLLTLSLLIVASESYEQWAKSGTRQKYVENVQHEGCRRFAPPKPDEKSVFFSEAFGRLGNHLLVYAFMAQLKISLNVDAYVNDECRAYLEKFFDPESLFVESLQKTFCDYAKIDFEFYSKDVTELLVDKAYRKGRAIYLFPNLTNGKGRFDGYSLSASEPSEQHDALIKAYARTMKRTLRFRPDIVERVRDIFDGVADTMGVAKKDVTFVGVHNRRTDHIAFVEKKAKKKALGKKYFREAMAEFREDHDNVAFMYVSDDMEWGVKNLAKESRKHGDVFFVGSGEPEDEFLIGVDFAILSSCNHSIVSRGTFSLWSSFLAGGERHNEYGTEVPEEFLDPHYEYEELIL